MLLELRVENLLLIERAELRLGPGLTAITGETGAGKTVLAHAFDLLLGGRPRTDIVRPGAREAYVEGVFAVPRGLLEDPATGSAVGPLVAYTAQRGGIEALTVRQGEEIGRPSTLETRTDGDGVIVGGDVVVLAEGRTVV